MTILYVCLAAWLGIGAILATICLIHDRRMKDTPIDKVTLFAMNVFLWPIFVVIWAVDPD